LGIEEIGVSSAEGLMILQDQMLSSVYWQETVRGLICMFHAVLAHLVKTDIKLFLDLVEELKHCKSDQEAVYKVFLPRVEHYKGPEREQLRRLIDLHINQQYPEVYIPIKTYRVNDEIPVFARQYIYRSIVQDITQSQSSLPINWDWVRDLRNAFIEAFKEKQILMQLLHLVVDVPYGKNSQRMVYIQNSRSGSDFPITDISHLNRSIFENPAAHLSPVRVYVAPEIYTKAGGRLNSIIESAEERFYDRSRASTRHNPTKDINVVQEKDSVNI